MKFPPVKFVVQCLESTDGHKKYSVIDFYKRHRAFTFTRLEKKKKKTP